MAIKTGIQWCDHTFNGWRGCVECSCGCAHCYARILSYRNPRLLGKWGKEGVGTRIVAAESYWREPLKWNRQARAAGVCRRVFSASLSDVFEEWEGPMHDIKGRQLFVSDEYAGFWVPDGCLDGLPPKYQAELWGKKTRPVRMQDARHRLLGMIAGTKGLDYLLLTKRPHIAKRYLGKKTNMWRAASHLAHAMYGPEGSIGDGLCEWPPSNVWLGVSVENRKDGLPRIDVLRTIKVPIRFLSIEPLLEDLGELDLTGIHWVIVGGESGSKARPFDLAWARKIRDQCREQGVACFIKQLGYRPFTREPARDSRIGVYAPTMSGKRDGSDDTYGLCLHDSHGGDWSEWPEDLRVRQLPR